MNAQAKKVDDRSGLAAMMAQKRAARLAGSSAKIGLAVSPAARPAASASQGWFVPGATNRATGGMIPVALGFAVLCAIALTMLVTPCAAVASSARAALGTTAALDPQGGLWIAYAQAPQGEAGQSAQAVHDVLVRRWDEAGGHWQDPIRVTSKPEPVSADGENRPKLAFGPEGEMYVSWTTPTSERFTGDIRFARSLDGGASWSEPVVLHRDRQQIAHRFESIIVDGDGRLWVTWIDKRDLQQAERAAAQAQGGAGASNYAGAAIYYAWSEDRGASWHGDFKLADHSCECCRIALARDPQGRAVAMWRHVFAPNERDHALARLEVQPGATTLQRVTFDRWRIDACPHHGPSLAFARDGGAHAVWFNQVGAEGVAFYGRLGQAAPQGVQRLPQGASHADVAVAGETVAIAWKRYDGTATKVESWVSHDGGRHFSPGAVASTKLDSDQPRLVSDGARILLVWRRADDTLVQRLAEAADASASRRDGSRARPSTGSGAETTIGSKAMQASSAIQAQVLPFMDRDTLEQIEARHAGQPFWLVLWDLECGYCMRSLEHLAQAQRAHPDLRVVTITTDPIELQPQILERLAKLGVRSEAYAFGAAPVEALRHAIDPGWLGEKPRAYRYDANGRREAIVGVIATRRFLAPEPARD